MVVLRLDGWIVDLFVRMPAALGLDYILGSPWTWPPIPHSLRETAIRLVYITAPVPPPTPPGDATFGEFLSGLAWRQGMILGGFLLWLWIRCFPTAQTVLTALWIEIVALFASVFALSIASLYAPPFVPILIYLLAQLLYSWLLYDIRQLRMLEIVGLPVVIDTDPLPSLSQHAAMHVFPKLPLVVGFIQLFQSPVRDVYWLFAASVAVIAIAALPTAYFVLNALLWRAYSANITGKARYRGTIRLGIISPYYVSVNVFFWQTIGEDHVNRTYAGFWLTKLAYHIGVRIYYVGISATISEAPEIFVESVISSWITLSGACCVAAYLYCLAVELWLRSTEVQPSEPHQKELSELRYDLMGYLSVVCTLAGFLVGSNSTSFNHLVRVVYFFALYKLPRLPVFAGNYAQRLALNATPDVKLYVRTVIDGAVLPLLTGIVISTKIWRAPLRFREFVVGAWMRNGTEIFPEDFEIWIHGETLLTLCDLFVLLLVTVTNVWASYAHLVQKSRPKFWHIVLQKADWSDKLWKFCLREILTVFLHSVVIMLLWDDKVGMFFATVIYLSRLMDAMSALHQVVVQGIQGQIFCWSRCIIYALKAPEEETFAAWNDVCSICRLEETDRLSVCAFPCGHYFHRECIEEWLKRQMKCPMCMRKIWFNNGEIMMDKGD